MIDCEFLERERVRLRAKMAEDAATFISIQEIAEQYKYPSVLCGESKPQGKCLLA